jgi:hypothetical protein
MRYPLLHLYVEVPFILIHTSLMNRAFERQVKQYVMLRVRVWKWVWEFELYDTER